MEKLQLFRTAVRKEDICEMDFFFIKRVLINCIFQILLDLARVLFEEQGSLKTLMKTILHHVNSLLNCERSSILLTDYKDPECKSYTF